MPATRTQVYLTTQQRTRVDEIASAEGVTLAEIIRRALDAYLNSTSPSAEGALQTTFGADTQIDGPDRDEWYRG